MELNHWLVRPRPNPRADLRIICFPYAGGSASTYISWADWLPENVELIAVQLPGRASRMFEPAYSDIDALIRELVDIIPNIISRPYVLFGHSLGSRIAFELMSQCKDAGLKLPQHFIASGCRGPHIPPQEGPTYHLPDEEFIAKLSELNGTPREVLENVELMELYLPLLRADFKLADTYQYSSDTVFDCPISVFGGKDDDVTRDDLQSWESFFSHEADVRIIPGDHFFIESEKQLIANEVNIILKRVLSELNLKGDMLNNCSVA